MVDPNITFIEAVYDSALYKKAVELRYCVLRKPLGLFFSDEQLLNEKDDTHLVCQKDGQVVACVVLTPVDESTVKLRQMAVDPVFQKLRIGQQMLDEAERIVRGKGRMKITLHARETAIGFYEKSGYTATGDLFIDVTIPHKKMVKILTVEK